jgi:3-oxoacyl-[acyl-carrier protein] reductase
MEAARIYLHLCTTLGRLGNPEEVGELFAFLLSPRAAYLTGAIITMDGLRSF